MAKLISTFDTYTAQAPVRHRGTVAVGVTQRQVVHQHGAPPQLGGHHCGSQIRGSEHRKMRIMYVKVVNSG